MWSYFPWMDYVFHKSRGLWCWVTVSGMTAYTVSHIHIQISQIWIAIKILLHIFWFRTKVCFHKIGNKQQTGAPSHSHPNTPTPPSAGPTSVHIVPGLFLQILGFKFETFNMQRSSSCYSTLNLCTEPHPHMKTFRRSCVDWNVYTNTHTPL